MIFTPQLQAAAEQGALTTQLAQRVRPSRLPPEDGNRPDCPWGHLRTRCTPRGPPAPD
jgi:hypothetical protein